mgnify:FL=1|jgi:hypothetical protein
MGNDKSNIAIGLPNPKGALYWAPLGTTLPTDATTALDNAFINLGYVTEDGLTSSTAEEGDDIKVWGSEIVARNQTSYGRTFTFNLLEVCRASVLQFRYGKGNVKIETDGSITVDDTGEVLPHGVFVCETIETNSTGARRHRQVLGDAQFTDRSGDITFNNSDPLALPTSLTAYKFADSAGKLVYSKDYWSKNL